MNALASSVTLEDVLTAVEAKRVPLAPELAGYLTLEIAEGSQGHDSAIDLRNVYVSEEGSVALVHPVAAAAASPSPAPQRREEHDSEAHVRAILSALLAASGSSTPALSAAAKRRPNAGLTALVAELEAALIPVNRSAGRRATARLAREVKRVMLGLGRNASVPPPSTRSSRSSMPPPEEIPHRDDTNGRVRESAHASVSPSPSAQNSPSERVPPARPGFVSHLFAGDEVDSLLSTFDVPEPGETHLRTELKAIAGLEPTPPPPNAATLAELIRSAVQQAPPPPRAGARGLGEVPRRHEPHDESLEALMMAADADHSLPLSLTNAASKRLDPAAVTDDLTPRYGSGGQGVNGSEAHASHDDDGDEDEDDDRPTLLVHDVPKPKNAHLGLKVGLKTAGESPEGAFERSHAPAFPSATPRPREVPPPSGARNKTPPQALAPQVASSPSRFPFFFSCVVAALLVVLVGAGALWKFVGFSAQSPALSSQNRPNADSLATAKNRGTAPAAAPGPGSNSVPRCTAALVVSNVPAYAEILLRVGQAPLDIERMPVGARLEFVATAEGYVPKRAVVKSDSAWDQTPDGKPRIDVPVQLELSKLKPGMLEGWPPAEPGSQVGGAGAPGLVHVVSNVRGAEVWLLAGLGPEARIEQLRCDNDIEILLAGGKGGTAPLRKRLRVTEKEIQATPADGQGRRTVAIRAM